MTIRCPECNTDNPSDSKYCKECASSLPPSERASVTKTIEAPVKKLTKGITFAERYEIIQELGVGGMGEVYRVRDEKLDEEMALKVLKPEIAADKGMIERFKNELKLARKIAHRSAFLASCLHSHSCFTAILKQKGLEYRSASHRIL